MSKEAVPGCDDSPVRLTTVTADEQQEMYFRKEEGMPTHPRLVAVATDEAMEAAVISARLVSRFDRAIADGTIDGAEAAQLRSKILRLVNANHDTLTAISKADVWEKVAVACLQGGVNTYLAEQAEVHGIELHPLLALGASTTVPADIDADTA